ncbi:uncharacterized protein [Anoplolepis gracilipes]|uniref:uncharacterized protein n=1 Tax=Anoplolepis gracilipes TaxID=354296 RepID=UPI003BA00FC4
MLLTLFIEGMTDITLRITIPATTSRISTEEALVTTEKEILESTSITLTTEVTQSFLAETSISLFIISTVAPFTRETAELTIQITTATVPVLTLLIITKKPQTTTPIEETIFVTERIITSISPTIMPTKFTATLGGNTTLYKATMSKVTYVTRIETEIKDMISFTTQALTFATHIPTSTLKIIEETSLVTEKIKTTFIENSTTTESTPYITILSTIRFAPTVQITESTTETSISKITIIKSTTTAVTSSPTASEKMETISSTLTEIVITTLTPEEESPVTQIEKTITAEEITTTEIPTTIETPTTTEIPIISEISTLNETSTSSTTLTTIVVSSTTSTEILVTTEPTITKILTPSGISTITSLPTVNRTTTKPLTTTEISTLIEIPITTKIQTTIKTLIITETIESTSASSAIPVSLTAIKTIPTTLITRTKGPATTSVKTTVPITSLKLITTTPLSTTNITLRETPYTTISSTFLTTTIEAITTSSVKTTVPTTSLKLTTVTPLFLVTNTTLSETPCTISTTFLTEEIEITTFSITSATIKTLPTTLITTTPFLEASTVINETLFTTTFTTFKTATIETTTLSMTSITTSLFEITTPTTLSPSIVAISTTPSEITLSTISTEMAETTTLTTVSLTEIVSTTSLVELTTEERIATWITTERTIITEATTLMTYLPLSTTMIFIETTGKTTLFITVTAISSEEISTIEETTAVNFTTITEESSLIKEITNITSTTVAVSIPTKITVTESTIFVNETGIMNTSLASTIAVTTVSLLRETTTETSLITTSTTLLPITEKPEEITILKTEMTFTPLSEFTSVLITSETPATTTEVLSTTISEEREFIMTLTSPSITYTLESFTTSIERTVQSTLSTLAASTEEIPEVETEYYIAKEPFYEEYEEYQEYDTEIPDVWYYYEEYETTIKRMTVTSSTEKYTKLSTETATSPPFEGTTASYGTKTLEFTMYSTISTSIYTHAISTITRILYTEKEFTSSFALETSAMSIIENITTMKIGIEFTTSATSKEEESTTLTFGSTEEYTLLPSTIFEIITKPLESLTIPAKYTEPTSKFLTQIWYDITVSKFITQPEEISEIELERTSTSERISTETEFTIEKLTSFFVSSTLTTLSEREAFGITTASTAFSEIETAIEVASEATTLATMLITKEEIAPYTTIFIAPEIETEFITMRQTTSKIGREEEKKQLLQLLDDLKQRQKEMTEKEKRLKEKERQWEEEKRKEMMQHEKEKAENTTLITSTTASYVTTTIIETIIIPVTVSVQNLTLVPTVEIKITPLVGTLSLPEIITISTETMPLYITEEIFATYIAEKTEETATTESTFSTYIAEITEKTAVLYTTEESTSVTYITKETEEIYITNYTTLTSYIVASIADLYNVSLISIETTTPYTTKEMYTTSYGTVYLSEPLFTSSTMMFTSPITLAIDEFTTSTALFSISLYETGATSIAIPTRTTKERYTTSYVTSCTEFPFISSTMTLTSRITATITILHISITTPPSYTTEEIYSEFSFTSPTSVFIETTTALAISTTTKIEYDEEIENLKEKLRKKERELEEREKMLLEREERLQREITAFKEYMKELEKEEMHTLIELSEKPIVPTSLSTPVPPTERTTIKTQLTTQIKKVTEKKEKQTTTKMITTPRRETTKVKEVEEKEWTRHVPEKITTQAEEEIVTKRICLNVLENITIPFVIKKMCVPHFPEKNRKQKSVDRLSRKLLSFTNMKEIRQSKFQNFPSDFHYRGRREAIETTRKINNLQLSYYEWLSNETTKPMQHFKGFTRIYKKKGKSFLKDISAIINMQENSIHNFRGKTPLYEQYILDPYDSLFQPTATLLDNKKYGKRNAFLEQNLIPTRRNNFLNNDKYIKKRNVLSPEKSTRSWATKNITSVSNPKTTSIIREKKNLDEKENESYTVNVLHLSYNKDRETHEVISAKPNENELIMIMSESNNNINVNKFEEDAKSTTPYYEFEKKNDLQEEDNLQEEEKLEEDSFEDMLENYMNYEERTTLKPMTHDNKFLDDRDEDENKIESKTKLLDQVWPTEKSTTYHLGGTRYWELEVMEPSAPFSITTDKSKAIDISVTGTTCLYVVLKNEINTDVKTKRNIRYHKRNIYNNETRKYNISIEKRKIGFKNITKENTQNLRRLNRYEQNFEGKGKLDKFSRTNNEDSIIAKTRKLCSVNGNKLKHQINIKHKNANIKDKTEKKQSQNIKSRFPKSCIDRCIINKKNSDKAITIRTTANHYSQAKSSNNKKNDKKETNITVDHKNQSMCVSRERENHDYLNCICDIANVIENIKSILNRISFSLDEIKALNCSVYKETRDKIVISMDSDAEEGREFSQPHYNTESLKGQKYIKLEELKDDFKNDLELENDHDIVSLPGLNLNLPCNQDNDGITWLSSISRPSYTWKRTDGIAIFGFVAENGDLELRNVNAKDTGNYTCITTYMGPETEDPVVTTYEVHLQVVTLPRYIVHGENRYYTRSCDERDLDILITYLPVKLNDIICEANICNAYILTPSCSRSQITVNILLLPSHIVKLITIDPKHCNVFCLKAIQDKLSLILSKNLQIFFGKTIIFRLPHYEQRLVPIAEKSTFARWKRGRTNAFVGKASNIGLFSSCPAGYGLRGTHCVPCNMGTYSEDGISYCKKCPPGTYQPNHGARVCRTCTDPLTKGCYNMLWSSFSAIMITLASLGVMLLIFLLFLWIICCAKKKFCVKQIASIIPKEDAFIQEDPIEEQSLIKDESENQDQQWDNEYKAKKKKKKFYLNKKRRKQNERGKYEKIRAHEDKWGSHRIKNTPIFCPDSYRSHEDYNNYYSKQSYRKGPRLPECDFDT